MDPTTAWNIVREWNRAERPTDEQIALAAALVAWLNTGGFVPDGADRDEVYIVCRGLLASA